MESNSPNVRLSQTAKDQLIKLKRDTKLKQWNVLCRWALCYSLADASQPGQHHAGGDTALEIDWRTFAGEYEAIYMALLQQRCRTDGLEPTADTLQRVLRLHLHRGIASLAGTATMSSLSDLLRLTRAA